MSEISFGSESVGGGSSDAVKHMSERLAKAGISSPREEAEQILAHVTDTARGQTRMNIALNRPVEPKHLERIEHFIREREQRIPLQHLTGRAPFRHLELRVGPGVFIPRPETETLVEVALAHAKEFANNPTIVDLCAGSGAIALALATELPTNRMWAVEKNPHAAAWAQQNIQEIAAQSVRLVEADVTTLVSDPPPNFPAAHTFELIVTNPPYVPEHMVPVDPEVSEHDPQDALYSGEDGLDLIRQIAQIGVRLICPDGWLVIEHAEHQGVAVREILASAGWTHTNTHTDLTGRDRVTEGKFPSD